MNVDQAIVWGKRELRRHADNLSWVGNLHNEAFDLLELVLGHYPIKGEELNSSQQRRFEQLIGRRAAGEPLPYLLGWTEFGDLKMTIKPGGFVPRATSEWLAMQAASKIRRRTNPIAVDLACGIGPVALLVSHKVPGGRVYGADVSRSAIAQARANAHQLKLPVIFGVGDMFEPLPASIRGKVDAITMHPPYVGAGTVEDLPAEIKNYEPPESLTDGSDDGLGLVRRAITEGRAWLKPGQGWLLFEVEPPIARAVRSLLSKGGYRDVRSTVDKELPVTRVVIGRAP